MEAMQQPRRRTTFRSAVILIYGILCKLIGIALLLVALGLIVAYALQLQLGFSLDDGNRVGAAVGAIIIFGLFFLFLGGAIH